MRVMRDGRTCGACSSARCASSQQSNSRHARAVRTARQNLRLQNRRGFVVSPRSVCGSAGCVGEGQPPGGSQSAWHAWSLTASGTEASRLDAVHGWCGRPAVICRSHTELQSSLAASAVLRRRAKERQLQACGVGLDHAREVFVMRVHPQAAGSLAAWRRADACIH